MQDFPFNVDAAAVHSDFSSAESPVSEDPSESSGEAVTAAPAPTAPRYQPPRVPRIAIVGRPNVGKSSLMNMLAARRVSIVDNTPGTTRDRVSAIVSLEGENPTDKHIVVEMTDTGGYGVYTVEGRGITNDGHDLAPLGKDVERQIAHAVESADLVLFVIDTQTGVTPQDREVARLLREGGLGGGAPGDAATRRPGKHRKGSAQPLGADGTTPMTRQGSGAGRVIVLCNKCDGPRWEAHAFEAATLGFGEPLVVSAKNNYNRRHLVESLHAAVSKVLAREAATPTGGRAAGAANAPATLPAAAEMHLAIVGKRNAGKSTLVNTLAGEERVIVSEIAGTTRDAVDVRFQIGDRTFVAIDTAGLRKRKSFQDRIEWWALDRCELAIDRASVCLLMIDATVPISSVDKQLGMMIADRFKPVVIVVNKWDLARGKPIADGRTKRGRPRPVDTADYETYIRAELKGLWYAPIAFMSARDNHNVRETIELAFELFQQSQMRTTTGKLNRLVRNILDHQRPASGTGAFAKLLYVAQVAIAPPTIVCVVNHPDLFTPNYQRFLLNRFREELPFTEVPIKLLIRGRRRDEVIETQEGEIARVRDRSESAELTDAGTESDDLAGGAEPLAAGAPALGLTSDEAETIDWSVEPKSEADRYFDEPLAQPVRRESSGGVGDSDRTDHARGKAPRGEGKARKSRPRSGARPQPSDRTKPRMKAAAKARAGAKRGGQRGAQSGTKGRRDGPARGRSSSRG